MTAPDPSRFPPLSGAVRKAHFVAPRGRSTLLRAGQKEAGRPRPYLFRAAVIGVILGAVTVVAMATAGVWLSPDGPGRILYLLHDSVWLPLRGAFWTAPFPAGLIWLVPVLGVLGLMCVEFLGLASPLRRAQIIVLRRLVAGRGGALIVIWDGALRRFGLAAGQAHAVAVELRDAARSAVITAMEAGRPDVPVDVLLRRERLVLLLSEGADADLISAVEVLCFARLAGRAGASQGERLAQAVAQKAGARRAAWQTLTEQCLGTYPDLPTLLSWSDGLSRVPVDPVTAAVQTLRVVQSAGLGRRAEALQWFDVWARLRAGRDHALGQRLSQTEGLIAFEFWAAQAEARAASPSDDGLLAEALGGQIGPRERGEGFARHGGVQP